MIKVDKNAKELSSWSSKNGTKHSSAPHTQFHSGNTQPTLLQKYLFCQ